MPQKAVKPYDQDADGMVAGEGGSILVLEELQHALERALTFTEKWSVILL